MPTGWLFPIRTEHWPNWIFLTLSLSEWAVRFVALVVVPFRRSPATAKGWLLLIFFQPWLGLVVYLLFGRPHYPKVRDVRLAALDGRFAEVNRRLKASPNVSRPALAPGLIAAVELAEKLGGLPIFGGNRAEFLSDYHGAIDRLVSDIDDADVNIHLLYYIFADDETTAPVIDALRRASARGVVCRVLIDSVGSSGHARTLVPKLVEAGITVKEMLRVSLFRPLSARYDLRNHRKIAVIDGRIGYTGSQNLVSPKYKPGITYDDMVVRVRGPLVLELQYVFATDWFLETDEVLDGPSEFPTPEIPGNVAAQALPSGPNFPNQNNQRLIVALVHGGRRRVVITTPYFIPDESLLQAMQTAAQRGVEVHLIVSKLADQFFVNLAQRSYYEELLEAGVQIHLYSGRFLHAKHLSVDGDVAFIGSSNMDIRSFFLNAEISALFYDPEVTEELIAEQERCFLVSEPLSLDAWRNRGQVTVFAENLARMFSPLL